MYKYIYTYIHIYTYICITGHCVKIHAFCTMLDRGSDKFVVELS